MYKDLEANIPRDLMEFSDLSFPENIPLFPSYRDVKSYLDLYAEPLKALLCFNHRVTGVEKYPIEEKSGWRVQGQHTKNGSSFDVCFDAVLIASGHHDMPHFPNVKGLEEWKRQYPTSVLHSKYFRDVEFFRDKASECQPTITDMISIIV